MRRKHSGWPLAGVGMSFEQSKRPGGKSGRTGRPPMKNRWLRIVLIVVAVFVLILIALPFLINVNSFRPKIEAEASAALGRQVTIGNLSLSIFSGAVEADNVAIADDPAFSKSPFVTAKSLKIGVELMPLIFSKQLKVTDIVLEEPQITLLSGTHGTWNYSSMGGASEKRPTEQKAGGTAQEKPAEPKAGEPASQPL